MRAAVFLVFLLAACSGHRNAGSDTGKNTADTDQTTADRSPNFYKCYTGTVAGRPVIVQLSSYNGNMQGTYYYTAVGRNISLGNWGDSPAQPNGIVLHEMPGEGSAETEEKTPTWQLNIAGKEAHGQWFSADSSKQYNIELTENYADGITPLDARWIADSTALLPGNPKSPTATATCGYLVPVDGGEGSFIYDALKAQVAGNAAHGENIEQAIRSGMAAYFDDYRKEVAPMVQELDADLESFSFSYTSDDAVYVRYNADYWLVTEYFSASYTGGAHGNYGSSFTNIDRSQKRVWKLSDIVADTAALRPLLNDAAIAYFDLKPGEGMDQRLLVDEVPATENVYIGPKGLSFVYNPYEIASYADGQITFYLSYKKLLPLLTPDFRQRMKLGEGAGVAFRS